MNKELTDEQIDNELPLGMAPYLTLCGPTEIRRFARAVVAADRANQDARHAEELAAYELTISNLRAARGVPESAILQRVKYHWFDADPDVPGDAGDYEIFGRNIPCEDGCIDALIVREDMLAAAPKPTAQPERKPCPKCESLSRAVMMDQTAHDMNLIADRYAHKLALDLECVLADYSGKWWDAAMQTLGAYREAMNAIHERESPTWMGEPRL